MSELLISRPRHDISVDEVEMYLGGDRPSEGFAAGSPSHLVIELSPGVNTVVSWAGRNARPGSPVEIMQQKPPVSPDHGRLLSEMGMALEHAQYVLSQLTDDGNRKQGELFDSKSKRRRK
jgi:hypothetical protein